MIRIFIKKNTFSQPILKIKTDKQNEKYIQLSTKLHLD